ncbi:hypothetical protein Ndes2526B_g02050 [Nannochloris sp. 'desiccata']
MTTLQRLALLGKDVLFSSRIIPASQQLSSLRSFGLEGLGSASSSQWIWSDALGVQRILSLIPSLADVQLWAVPKRKVTPHRKGKRSANKHLRFIPMVSRCSKCDKVFPQHAMPSKCEEDDCPAFNLRERPASSKAFVDGKE